jgi:hypothetical protein
MKKNIYKSKEGACEMIKREEKKLLKFKPFVIFERILILNITNISFSPPLTIIYYHLDQILKLQRPIIIQLLLQMLQFHVKNEYIDKHYCLVSVKGANQFAAVLENDWVISLFLK